ncbi:MAG: F0F1 ATP synthase subunit B [Clostridiales bacterium]|nr:F0F1 ATP synthase subunit B [Clostridiales bacterium]
MGDVIQNLGLNSTLFAQLVSFIILVWALSRWVWGPLTRLMESRADRVANMLAEAENKLAEANRMQEEAAKALQEARQEARAILERSERTAQAQAQEILSSARREAEEQLQRAKEAIARERDQALLELRSEVADLAVKVAEKILQAQVDDRVQRELVEQFVAEVASR